LAALQGCAGATFAKSTLHLFWDLFGLLAREPIAIYLDARAYPTARWGVERAAGRGTPVQRFPHHDRAALTALLRQEGDGRRAIVVADGVCGCCGCAAPVAAYLKLVRRVGGLLVLDDTQALGLLGHAPGPQAPFGQGGGGSLRWAQVSGPDVIVVSSLAKAFGAPLAALSGSREVLDRYTAQSETRMHCSPPSAADLHAAQSALQRNAAQGDELRAQLAQRVRYFRARLAAAGIRATGGSFPIQTVELPHALDPRLVYTQLLRQDVRAILRRIQQSRAPAISFVLTARHTTDEIDDAVHKLAQALHRQPAQQREHG
jgi:8-amino-7-oxononanoate synthase